MNKKIKTALIVAVCIIVGLVLMHILMNNFIPFIKKMHSGGMY